ncbi:MAG: hypothetical protein KKA32_05305 [Actinobacteria bacterium]|nr:hypothetical protein [Actinomycetota bacterium]
MLLDRKRINRWAKWVALGLAIVFGLSFVFMGVGSGLNVDWTSLWGGPGSTSATSGSASSGVAEYEQALAADPNDLAALIGIANEYESLGQPLLAAPYLERAAQAKPDDLGLLMRLGEIYLHPDSLDYAAAVRVFNQATLLDPNNAQGFLRLGVANRGAGNISATILAWSRYLQLDPDGELAETVRAELEAMSPTVTTVGSSETTVPAGEGDASPTTTTTQ